MANYGQMREVGNPFAAEDTFGSASSAAPAVGSDGTFAPAYAPPAASAPPNPQAAGLPSSFLPATTVAPKQPPQVAQSEPVMLQSIPAQRKSLESSSADSLQKRFKQLLCVLAVFAVLKAIVSGVTFQFLFGTGFVFVASFIGLVVCGMVGVSSRRADCMWAHCTCGFICSAGLSCSVLLQCMAMVLYFMEAKIFVVITTAVSTVVMFALCLTTISSASIAKKLAEEYADASNNLSLPMVSTEAHHSQPVGV